MNQNPIATIRMGSGADIVLELFPQHAPNTVNSFIWVAGQGLYDQCQIERIVPGFVIQPSCQAFGKPECDFEIDGEFAGNGFANPLKNDVGCVAMGGDGRTMASGSEFYFTLAYVPRLDGNYPVFGRVIRGWEEVRRLEQVPLVPMPSPAPGVVINRPAQPEWIERVTVETFGAQYPDPVRREKRA